MASLRQLAACLGLLPTFSVVRDFFGYASPPPWANAPAQPNLPQSLSLLTQVKRIRQPHFNLNLIRVGTLDDGVLDPVDEENVDCAVQLARNIYAAIGVGIGRVDRWWYIPRSWETGYDVINDDCEADELIDAYDLPENGIKVFFVTEWYGDTVGRTDGDEDGSVVLLRPKNWLGTGRTLAHELGHMFGLGHENDNTSNLMAQSGNLSDAEKANPIPATTGFYTRQVEDVKEDEEWIREAC
jgi:hypothetical protein